MRPGTVIRPLLALALVLTVAASLTAAVSAAGPSMAVSPHSGSATQLVKMTYTGALCGIYGSTVEFLWDNVGEGIGSLTLLNGCKATISVNAPLSKRAVGPHKICGLEGSAPLVCATYTILAPKPKATPKPTLKPTPTASPSPSPTPTPTAVALVTATPTPTPTPAPAPPSASGASSLPDIATGAGGAAADFTLLWIGGAIFLGLLVGVVIAAVRRVRPG